MTQRALLIGYGSIGERHARVLESLGYSVKVVSRREEGDGRQVYRSIPEACASGPYDYAVIADETSRHATSLADLAEAGHAGFALVEKPLFAEPTVMPNNVFRAAGVGYSLRFHPAVQALRAAISGRKVLMANFYVGQYLADWRLTRDLAESYSSSRELGGGILRDLSHELDLATWLFGDWQRATASGGRLGNITVDADDGWGILLACADCTVVTMELNGLDRKGRRYITVQTEAGSLRADLVAGTLETDRSPPESFAVDRDAMTLAMHRALIRGQADICSLEEGARTVDLIAAIEQAAQESRWIVRNRP